MVGVANIAAHWHTEQLATKMVFQSGPDNLLAVIQIFRSDKADYGIDQQGIKLTRHGVGTRFQSLLIHAMMTIARQGTTLSGFKIHDILAHGAALQAQGRLITFL